MTFRASDRVYIDESKARGYYVVATASTASSVHESNRALRALLKPGQRRIHFKSERDSRRRHIISRMCELKLRVTVWEARGYPDKEARPRCFTALTEAAIRGGVAQLYIERDDSLVSADRRIIASVLRREPPSSMHYQHVSPHEHPLLWVSDAVAWCHSHGGDWLRRVSPIVRSRVDVS